MPDPKLILTLEAIRKKRDAIEFLRKNGENEMANIQEKALEKLIAETSAGVRDAYSSETEKWLKTFITSDNRMISLKETVRKLAPEDDTVLIMGESGTGKELIAHALHGNRQGTFISVNCAGMPTELIEAELFGHVRGAFTGADKDKDGLFKAADKGTLFLDEIGDMPLIVQAKLLRALQQKAIRPVGANLEFKVDVRVVCATHHRLDELVGKGTFRLDLYSRIQTFILHTLPIRERRGDIKAIVDSLDVKGLNIYEGIAKQMHEAKMPDGSTPYDNFWNEAPFNMNIRDLQAMARQFTVLGKVL